MIWGGLHGVGQAVGRRRRRRRRLAGLPELAGGAWAVARQRFWTFLFVSFAWVFFAAGAAASAPAHDVLAQLFRAWGSVGDDLTWGVLLAIVLGIGVQYVPQRLWLAVQVAFSRQAVVVQGLLIALGLLVLSAFGPEGAASFLYFGF